MSRGGNAIYVTIPGRFLSQIEQAINNQDVHIVETKKLFQGLMICSQKNQNCAKSGIMNGTRMFRQGRFHTVQEEKFGGNAETIMNGKQRLIIEEAKGEDARFAKISKHGQDIMI